MTCWRNFRFYEAQCGVQGRFFFRHRLPACPNRIKLGRTQSEQMSSELASKADIA